MAGRRRKHFKLSGLPPDLLAAVNDRLAAGATYAEVTALVRGEGHDVSPSAVARYGQQFAFVLEEANRTRDWVRTLASETGMDPLEMESGGIKVVLHRLVSAFTQAQDLDKASAIEMARVIGQISRSSAEVEKVRARVLADIQMRLKEAAEAASERVQKRVGGRLTPEELTYIRTELMGLTA